MKYLRPGFTGGIAVTIAMLLSAPAAFAGTYDLVIGETTLDASGTERPALAIKDSIPAPTLRFFEGEELTIDVINTLEADAPGRWAFHCHLMYHMATGMFREVVVEDDSEVTLVN